MHCKINSTGKHSYGLKSKAGICSACGHICDCPICTRIRERNGTVLHVHDTPELQKRIARLEDNLDNKFDYLNGKLTDMSREIHHSGKSDASFEERQILSKKLFIYVQKLEALLQICDIKDVVEDEMISSKMGIPTIHEFRRIANILANIK